MMLYRYGRENVHKRVRKHRRYERLAATRNSIIALSPLSHCYTFLSTSKWYILLGSKWQTWYTN